MNDERVYDVNFKDPKMSKKIKRKISNLVPVLCIAAFLALGFIKNAWHPGWVVFVAIPITEILLGLLSKRGKEFYVSLSFIVSAVAYVTLGFCLNAWHPGWLVFFLVPVTAILAD